MKKIWMLGIVFLILLSLAGITNYIDSGRVTTGHEPKFCVKIVNDEKNKVTYWGLGYKVVRYVNVSLNEPYESNIGVKMGNWFMHYELPINHEKSVAVDKTIHSIDDFYGTTVTKENDIRNLSQEYSFLDAQKDNCFVIGTVMYNEQVYEEFKQKYQQNQTCFIRVAQSTVEGDLILNDILYYQETNQFYLIKDNTRDEFAASEDRTIEMKQFEHIAEYEHHDQMYWILYNGEMEEQKLETDQVFVITVI